LGLPKVVFQIKLFCLLTHPPIQCVPGALFLGEEWLGHEADNSPPSSAEVKSEWNYTSTPPICLHGIVLS